MGGKLGIVAQVCSSSIEEVETAFPRLAGQLV